MAGTTTAFTFARGALSTRESFHPVYVSGRTPFDFSFASADKASRAAQPARIKPRRFAAVVFISAWIISKDRWNRHDEKARAPALLLNGRSRRMRATADRRFGPVTTPQEATE